MTLSKVYYIQSLGYSKTSTPIPCPIDRDDIVPFNASISIDRAYIYKQSEGISLFLVLFCFVFCFSGGEVVVCLWFVAQQNGGGGGGTTLIFPWNGASDVNV